MASLVFMRVVVVTLCVCFTCGALIKFIYYKERPHPQPYKNRMGKIDASSFPSIHTAYATIFMAAGMFLAFFIYQYHTIWMILGAFELAMISLVFYIIIARSRIVLKKHFFIDTIFGTLLGFIAILFSVIHIDAILGVFDLIVK